MTEHVRAPAAITPTQTGNVRARKVAMIALLSAMLVVHNAQRTGVVPIFADLQREFSTDYAGVGTLFAAYVFGYAISQAIVGAIGDRFNARVLLLIGLTLSAVFSAIFAAVHVYAVALVVRFLLGATGAFLYTPAMKLGITLFDRDERGRVMGFLQAGAGLGAVGALILVPVVSTWLGITGALAALPVFTVLVLIAGWVLLPDAPPQPRTPRVAGRRTGLGWRADFWQLLAVSFTGMLATYGLLTWLPTYLTTSYGYSAVQAGTFTSAANIALLIAAPIVGIVADLPLGRSAVVLGGSVLAFCCYLLLVPPQPAGVVLLLTTLMGISLAATTAPLMLFAGERFGAGETARVVALLATVAQLGATLAGVVFGYILTYSGRFQIVWIACASLASLRLALFVPLAWHALRRRETIAHEST